MPGSGHLNRNRADNRADNLRWVSHADTSANRTPSGKGPTRKVEQRAQDGGLGELVPGADGKMVSRFDRDIKGPLTVEYNELSAKIGKPLQAKALVFRTYESGPDPVKAVLDDCLPRR